MKAATVVFFGIALVGPSFASAQDDSPPYDRSERVLVSLGAGFQFAPAEFGYGTAVTILSRTTAVDSALSASGTPAYEAGMAVRIARGLGIGANLTHFELEQNARTTVDIRSAFLARPATASRDDPAHRAETALHLQVSYTVPLGRRLQMMVSAGPSHFRFEQELVDSFGLRFGLAPEPPEELTVTSVSVKTVRGSVWGYNAGVDVRYLFPNHAGIGVTARYGRASASVANPFEEGFVAEAQHAFDIDLGGLTVMAGVRLRF